ncbi:hypothetical protein ACFW2V_14105 [Streptomyces sp. NPDC058947]|uniref:hypothetical protein n=1 Tax=Streptomyces sp. NPDC058947 TaxID=3346675 RepID=UPI0036ADEC47
MTEPIGNPNFSSEQAMERVDEILASIEDGYGLTRNEAFHCLEAMALALTQFRPGDPGLQACFHNGVVESVNDFQTWAEKVDRAIESWEEKA